jgi:hypothetical protein
VVVAPTDYRCECVSNKVRVEARQYFIWIEGFTTKIKSTVWAPKIPPAKTYHFCDFPPDTKFHLGLVQVVVNRTG